MTRQETANNLSSEGDPRHLSLGEIWKRVGVVITPKDGGGGRKENVFSSREEHPGMDATQALQDMILSQFAGKNGEVDKGAKERYERWLGDKKNREIKPSIDNIWGWAMTPQEKAHNWVRSTVESAILWQTVLERKRAGKKTERIKQKCFDQMAKCERLWKKIGVRKDDWVEFESGKSEVWTTNPRPETILDRYLDSDDPHVIPRDLIPGMKIFLPRLGPSIAMLETAALLAACGGGGPVQTTEVTPAPTEIPATRTPIRTPSTIPVTGETPLSNSSPTIPASETQTTVEWERVEHNVEAFLNMPEQEYRDWVNQNAFIPDQTNHESTYIFPIDADGFSLAEKMGVKDLTLGLVDVGNDEYRSGDSLIGTSLHSFWQGIYLGGRQINYDSETRVTISFFGVEVSGNRVVLPVVTGYEGISDASFTSRAMISSSGNIYTRSSLQSEVVSFNQLQDKLSENEGRLVIFELTFESSDSLVQWRGANNTPLTKCLFALLYADGGEIRNGNLTHFFMDHFGKVVTANEIAEVIPDISSNEKYFVSDFMFFNFLNDGATFSLGK